MQRERKNIAENLPSYSHLHCVDLTMTTTSDVRTSITSHADKGYIELLTCLTVFSVT